MYELKKNGKVFTSKFVGTGPLSYEKKNSPGRGLTKVEKHCHRAWYAPQESCCTCVITRAVCKMEVMSDWPLLCSLYHWNFFLCKLFLYVEPPPDEPVTVQHMPKFRESKINNIQYFQNIQNSSGPGQALIEWVPRFIPGDRVARVWNG